MKRALPEDLSELSAIMTAGKAGMSNPEWFIADSEAYMREHIGHIPVLAEDLGFTLKAVTLINGQEVIAGFFMVAFPDSYEKNLGSHLAMNEEQLRKVAHMDSVVILPEFRGYKLQFRLMAAAEEVLRKETDYTIWLATVHPDNQYSLANVQAHGYEIVAEVVKYGGYRRYILKKEI